jgi:L-2,4-diaminobutyric acid acetyltransferase
MPKKEKSDFKLRKVEKKDIREVYKLLVQNRPFVGLNSRYTYLLLAKDFSDTCIVAEHDGKVVAFSSGYICPNKKDTLFNWEIVVHPDYRGNGLQKKMLLFQLRNAGVSYLECTVNPSNRVSKRNFRELAKALKTQCKEDMMFSEKDFENDGHEAEVLFRIGPFSSHDIDCLVQPRDLNNLGACGKNNHD